MRTNGDRPHQGKLINIYNIICFIVLPFALLHYVYTYSTMELNLSAVHSSVTLYSGWDYTEFASLAHIPIRSVTECYKLNDIITAGNKLHNSHINLLVAVKNVSNVSNEICMSHLLLNRLAIPGVLFLKGGNH